MYRIKQHVHVPESMKSNTRYRRKMLERQCYFFFFFEQYYEYFEAWIVDRFSAILNGSYDKWFL